MNRSRQLMMDIFTNPEEGHHLICKLTHTEYGMAYKGHDTLCPIAIAQVITILSKKLTEKFNLSNEEISELMTATMNATHLEEKPK